MALLLNPDRPGVFTIIKNRLAAVVFTGCFVCLSGQFLSGCAAISGTGPAPYPAMSEGLITEEIDSVETSLLRVSNQYFNKSQRAELLLRLAMLYSHPDNPAQDYNRAIDCLEQYTGLEKTVNAEYALSLLKRLSEYASGKNKACAELMKQKKELEQQNRLLLEENLRYQQIIEKLKSLDIQLEKRRKTFN